MVKNSLSVLLVALAVAGCHALSPAQQARFDQRECEVAAVAKVASPALDAAQLVERLYSGSANMGQVLQNLGATREEVQTLLSDLKACQPAVVAEPDVEPALAPSSDPS